MQIHRLLPSLLTLVVSLSAFADRPNHPGGSRAFVPVVVHGGGIDSQFRSDLFLFNRGASDANIHLIFTPSGANGSTQYIAKQRFLGPNQLLAIDDIVATLFETSGSGSLEINSDSNALVARSTTHNVRARGKVSQSVTVATSDDAVGIDEEPLYLMPVERSQQWRTNIGFTETFGHPGVVTVNTYSAIGKIDSVDIPILPYSHVQIPVQTEEDGFFTVISGSVEVTSGNARVVAYASVVENLSGDPMYVTGRSATPPGTQVIPVAAHFHGSNWASEMWYANVLWSRIFDFPTLQILPIPGEPPTLTFYPSHDPSASRTFSDFGIASYSNSAVFTYFEFFEGAFGQISVPPSDGSLITTRLSTPAGGSRFVVGTVGQTIEPVPVTHAIGAGQSVDAIGVSMTDARRTNIGISEISGAPVRVRVTLHFPDGTEVGAREIDVAGRGVVQFPITSLATGHIPFGRVRFTVIGGIGRVLAYASVIENAYGDPTFVLAE